MGGHHTKQTVNATTDIISNAVMNSMQNCVTYATGTQVISIDGTGNIVTQNVQSMTMSIQTDCVKQAVQSAEFFNDLTDQITQTIDQQTVALTQWLDSGSDTAESTINQSVTTNITENDIQNCLFSMNNKQLMVVKGDYNVLSGNVQQQKSSMVGQCLSNSTQASQAINDIANTTNQHSTYDSKNPFAFITDAFAAVFKSALAIAAVVFIMITILVIVFELGTKKKKAAAAPALPVLPATRTTSV